MIINNKTKNKHMVLYFDKFQFPTTYDYVIRFILDEMKRLALETGYGIDNLPINFRESTKGDSTIACFMHSQNDPISFTFYLDKFDKMSPNKILDTCRHEFAHYMTFMKHRGHLPKNPHGAEWAKECKRVGAAPKAYKNRVLTEHFRQSKNKKSAC